MGKVFNRRGLLLTLKCVLGTSILILKSVRDRFYYYIWSGWTGFSGEGGGPSLL